MKSKKVLIVLTSHEKLGKTGKKTGYYLPELTHPYYQLLDAGFTVDLASIKGGNPPMDESSRDLSDPRNKRFLEDKDAVNKLEDTHKLSEIDTADYAAILFAGGHGTMWDFPVANEVKKKTASIYENGGVVAAVCHGPAALVNVKLSDGSFLVNGKKVTGFSNSEEDAMKLSDEMPFMLETELKNNGGIYSSANDWQENVEVDGRLVTGQNPASASAVGKSIAELLK